MASILLADDHPLIAEGFRAMLEDDRDMRLVAVATSGSQAIQLTRKLKPDVLVLDISMTDMSGFEVAQALRKYHIKILFLSIHSDRRFATRVMQSGANGFISKTCPPEEIRAAIRAVHEGRDYFNFGISAMKATIPRNEAADLTKREREVLELLAKGYGNKETSEKLGISVRTVEEHRTNLKSKLHTKNLTGLTAFGMNHQISDFSNSWRGGDSNV
jgi:two-component system, NarL family, nitrate/nitrite response regulator NarL